MTFTYAGIESMNKVGWINLMNWLDQNGFCRYSQLDSIDLQTAYKFSYTILPCLEI